ncbi:MAG: hypothetical protein C0626_06060 [Arcobacter sp.]|uniref:hypothetical protein n=1 Tax=uncultured Arcobacter sp. TaxID=165434 RepID=UPI000CB8D9C3|nr:hypothetical protein [uncultured Arcobacter sp.]PLY10532.1 MAG: hypothetical protein C0626_06060 [Arcobacter sp.]
MKFKLVLLSLFAMLFFNACAPQNIPVAKLKSIDSIGVISLHGNEMISLERGLTIFGNEDNITDISAWNIDEYIQKVMLNMLSTKYKVKNIKLSSSQIKEINGEYEKRLQVLKDILLRNRLDTLILFEKGMIVREHYDTHSGIGLIKAKALGMEATHIKLNMDLLSYEIVEGKIEELHFNDIKTFKEIDNSLWMNTTKPLSKESSKIIEPIVKNLLKDSLLKEFITIGYLNEK